MDFTLESKACAACAKAKRKCGKQIPTCDRCASRGISCDYPAAKAHTALCPQQQQESQSTPRTSTAHVAAIPTPTIADILFDIPGDDMAIDDLYPFHFQDAAMVPSPPRSVNVNPKNDLLPWYLDSCSWELDHLPDTEVPPHYSATVLLDHIESIKNWQGRWVRTGSNPYIHSNIYRFRMPRCVQDAYTTLSTYLERTPENKPVVVKIVEDRVRQLLDDQPVRIEGDDGEIHQALGPFEHLARVHALHVYQTIGLFDGDIRLRHVAETQIPTLNSWSRQLIHAAKAAAAQGLQNLVMPVLVPPEVSKRPCAAVPAAATVATATLYTGTMAMTSGTYLGLGLPVCTANRQHQGSRNDDKDHNDVFVTPRVSQEELEWYGWSLAETIRRTWMAVTALQTIYLTLQVRVTPCPGRAMFTAWEGQWDAKTAFAWASKCRETGGGGQQSIDYISHTGWSGSEMFESGRPEDIDEFAMEVLRMTYGWERVEKWIITSKGANGQRRW